MGFAGAVVGCAGGVVRRAVDVAPGVVLPVVWGVVFPGTVVVVTVVFGALGFQVTSATPRFVVWYMN